jgi:hypothetical protein
MQFLVNPTARDIIIDGSNSYHATISIGRKRSMSEVSISSIAALFARFASRDDADCADHLLSVMRKQFGGHEEKKDKGVRWTINISAQRRPMHW